jgi:polysaccharide transporter, PST family
MSGFKKNLVAMYCVQVLNLLIPLLTMPFLYRALGAEQFGRMAMALSLGMMVVMTVDAGFPTAALRMISKAAGNRSLATRTGGGTIGRVFMATQQIRIGISAIAVSAAAVALSLLAIEPSDKALYAWAALNVLGTLSFPAYYFTAQQLNVVMAWCHFAGRLISAALLITLIRTPNDTVLAVVITSSATLLSGVVAHVWLCSSKRLELLHYLRWRTCDVRLITAKTTHLYATQVLQAFIVNAPVLLIGASFGKAEAGYFSAVDRIVRVFVAFIEPINAVGMPLLNRLRKSSASTASPHNADRLFYASSTLGVMGAVLGAALAEPLLQLLLGSTQVGQVLLLRCLLAWSVLHAMARSLESRQLVVSGKMLDHRKVMLWVIPAQLFTLLLASSFGSLATAFGMVATECVALTLFARSAGHFRTIR